MELNITNLISAKSKGESIPIYVSIDDTVLDVKKKIKSNLNISLDLTRIGMSLIPKSQTPSQNPKKVSLNNTWKKILDYGVQPGDEISVKDLGLQISWSLVYVIEYLGPLLIVLLFFILKGHFNQSHVVNLAFIMSTFHYLKRILETILVHKFSQDTLPISQLAKNCIYYWGLYGLFCGNYVFLCTDECVGYNPLGNFRYFFAFLFFCAEIKNLKCHLIQRDLKDANRGEKGIPHGEGFELVSCANYFWEIVCWFCFSVFIWHWSLIVFTVAGAYVMTGWALKRHSNYKKIFGDRYPKNRKAIFPYIL